MEERQGLQRRHSPEHLEIHADLWLDGEVRRKIMQRNEKKPINLALEKSIIKQSSCWH
jgi:hypothetical protein